jgi:uncharacterized protein Yka (UPF0111/DUF47 family)
MFSSLMPQRKEFYELLAAHSDRVVAGANATLRLVNSLGLGSQDTAALVSEVNTNEKSADKIKAELITLLHKSFTTPINRDQIHTLTIDLDNVRQRPAGRGQCGGHVQHQGVHAGGA